MSATTAPTVGFHVLPPADKLGEMAIRLGITIAVAFVAQRALFLLVGRATKIFVATGDGGEHARQRAHTISHTLRNVVTTLVAGTAVINGLSILGWDVKALLAGVGVIGLAISFGAQTLVRDVIAGLFILVEDQFSIGELIEVNGKAATVEEMSLRATHLRDFNGFLYFVPNGEMRIVTNRSRGWQRVAVDVPIATTQNLDRALETCRQVVSQMNADPIWKDRMLDPIEVWGLEALGPTEATIRLVVRGRPGPDVPDIARALRQNVHRAFLDAGLETTSGRTIQINPIASDEAKSPSGTV